MYRSVILVGASVRSLAESAVQSGLQPLCADMFADQDLRQLLRESGSPDPVCFTRFEQLPDLLRQMRPSAPLVWTGGLENHPDLLRRISHTRSVAGIDADLLSRLRSMAGLQQLVSGPEMRLPETITTWQIDQPLPNNGQWLVKPVAGSGGLGIRRFQPGMTLSPTDWLQEFIPGLPVSALYCSDGRTTSLLGVSQQLIGEIGLGAGEFAFCGNIGPIHPSPNVLSALTAFGERIGGHGAVGVFGADFMISSAEIWLIEINPRITASHEIHDFQNSQQPPILLQHLQAVTGGEFTSSTHSTSRAGLLPQDDRYDSAPAMLARMIVWQCREATVSPALARQLANFSRRSNPVPSHQHWLADIPSPGPMIAGQPCCSVYHVLRREQDHWVAADQESAGKADQLLGRLTGIEDLNTAEIAARHASLFGRTTGRDNGQTSVAPII